MQQAAARPRILYIEDNPEARTLVSRLLVFAYDVLEAEDGLKGIALAQKARPDLVLVDLHMPHLTGYEVATRIKSLLPQVPIVALTADVTANVRERVLASGCDGYISKPIDPDSFPDQIRAYLDGAREVLQDDSFRQAYQQALVARLEEKVRELTQALAHNKELYEQNLQLLKKAQRQTRLLEAGARVGRSITSILDLDALLHATVDIICDEFGFYFAGIFLIDEGGEWAVLRAGRGEAGQQMVAQDYRLRIGDPSMVGQAAQSGQACIALDAEQAADTSQNPLLPLTRSEIALPLHIGRQNIGVLNVQSTEQAAFSEDDLTALQALAEQLAVAIDNARLLKRLESAHQELVRSKTYEAIANATGEAIHWVGNKAAPIPGSVSRIGEDVVRYLCLANALLAQSPPDLRAHKFAALLAQTVKDMTAQGINQSDILAGLETRSLEQLRRTLSLASIFEDLDIIQNSAQAILNLKEDLIGPARQIKIAAVALPDLLDETIASMGIPDDVVHTAYDADLPPVRADRVQLGRVLVNLIKNALEAMEHRADKRLSIAAHQADEPGLIAIEVADNGVGIPPDQIDQVWMAFYTTKGDRGGTGLGLPACAQIVGQLGGKITVESNVGQGTTFSVFLPAME